MDFGIARALHGAQSTMTQTGMVMGTPQYLSPEQALGKAVDHRSDLYATGCLLYELLALRPPFTGETPLSVVYQHVQDIPVPPSQVSDTVPPELDGLVMRALAKEPDDRFQTAEEMRGLVQYGLQMLYDQGGHTGTWNTGPVDAHDGLHTPAAGFAGSALPYPGDSGTTQIPSPILPPPGGGDDGGFEGHGNRGSGRGKLWILAVFAVIAIAAGVALALNTTGNGDGGSGTTKSPTTSSSTKDSNDSSATPSDDSTNDATDNSTNDNTGTGSGTGSTPTTTPSDEPTEKPTDEPTEKPTTTPTKTTPSEKPTTTPSDPPVSPPASGGSGGDGGDPES
jgi:serine/threonine protein kinase